VSRGDAAAAAQVVCFSGLMRRLVLTLPATAALLLGTALPAGAVGPQAGLATTLDAILAGSGSTAMSVRVDVAGRGEVFSRTASRTVSPASTQKIVTGYTALRVLGPSYRFVTCVGSAVAADKNGTLHGRLVVTASGDPTLTTAGLVSLGRQLRMRGIHAVTGGLQLDDTHLSRVRRAAGWKDEWVPGEVGPLSAFAVNGNSWRADAGYLANPAAGNLRALRTAFATAGVTVSGPVTVGRSTARLHVLGSIFSPPVLGIVHDMLKRSVNFDAELLLEDIGARTGNPTPAGGVAAVRALATAMHVQLGGNIEDGSGLSAYDRVSADGEVAWLEAVMASSFGGILYAGLPVGCVDGTLVHRFCGTSAAGRVHAKTGTLDGMRALSGFVVNAAGHRVTFAFLVGGPLSSAARGKAAIDRAVVALAQSHL
jgi:D-alanyl-D-alanine carboxypeptidase/D-alanyl-D-alanine-endopeptidase (penicillin-binding protein 4)